MENKDKLKRILEENRLKKVYANLSQKLVELFGVEISIKIIRDSNKVRLLVDRSYDLIRQKQKQGESFKYDSFPAALNQALKQISMLEGECLLLIIWTDERYCVLELEKADVKANLTKFWALTEGDLIMASPDLKQGVCLEFNHYSNYDEYEVSAWKVSDRL